MINALRHSKTPTPTPSTASTHIQMLRNIQTLVVKNNNETTAALIHQDAEMEKKQAA